MRTTLIVATLALSTLAVPVPQSQLDEGTEVHGCFRSDSPRDGQTDIRSPEQKLRACRITHPRDIEDNDATTIATRLPAPAPFNRGSHPPGVEDEETVEARAIRNEGLSHGAKPKGSNGKREPIYRAGGRRDAEPEPVVRPVKNQKRADEDRGDVEARAIRNQGRSPSWSLPRNTRDEDIQARGAIRNGNSKRDAEPEPVVRPVKNQRRADEDDEDVEVDAIRNEGKRSVREKTVSVEDVEDVEARAIRNEGRRSVREKTVVPDEDVEVGRSVREKTLSDEDVEARAVRGSDYKKRSDDGTEARGAIRNQGSKRSAGLTVRPGNNGAICSPGHVTSKCGFNKRATDNDQDTDAVEARGSDKRTAEPTIRGPRTGSNKRTPKAEPTIRGPRTGSNKRTPEAEPTIRGPRTGSNKRTPEAEPTIRGPRTGSNKRTAEPQRVRGSDNLKRTTEDKSEAVA